MDAELESHGRFWKVKVGPRSTLPGVYTSERKAYIAGKNHYTNLANVEEKKKAKHAKKTKS